VSVHNLIPRSFASPTVQQDDPEHDARANPMFDLICQSFLGQQSADTPMDMSAARDELRCRRAAGNKVLNSFDDTFDLAVHVVAMSGLQRMTLGTYGKSFEDQRKRAALEPEFYETVARASSVLRSEISLLRCDPSQQLHGSSPWCLLPWREGCVLPEEWRLRMRASVLLSAAGIFSV